MDARTSHEDDRSEAHRRWLARNGRSVVRLLLAPPDAWGDSGFRRQVEDVRRGLMPIHSRRSLVASFAREGVLLARPLDPSLVTAGPLPLAYAIRWHELGRPSATRAHRDAPAA